MLIDRLGSGPHSATYIARPRDGEDRCVLKTLKDISHDGETTRDRLRSLARQSTDVASEHVVIPDRVVEHDGNPVLLSRFVAGRPLSELLIRRGRFPAPIVEEIGRQLIDGLAALETAGLIHGGITLWNTRVTSMGDVVLVDAGVAPIVETEFLVKADVAPERYDGIAPERIATGQSADVRSDMYALGCLLWQLAAGRPPFPTGDPLTKLASHQTRVIPDIREWAPDTPDALARVIAALTAFEPGDRSESFERLATDWGRPQPSGRRRLRSFQAGFRGVARVPRDGPRSRILKTTALAALVAIVGVLGLGLADSETRRTLKTNWQALLAGSAGTDHVAMTGDNFATPSPRTEPGKPLPSPDSTGQIVLKSEGPYVWDRTIRAADRVVIRAADGVRPVIVVGSTPARIAAADVTLEGLRFRIAASTKATPPAEFLQVAAARLTIRRCRFDASAGVRGTVRFARGRVRSVMVADTVFNTPGHGLQFSSNPDLIRLDNVLQTGGGALLRLDDASGGGPSTGVALTRVTQRRAAALLDVAVPSTGISIVAKACVFHYDGKQAAFCRLRSNFPGRVPSRSVVYSGESSLIPSGTKIAVEAATTQDGSDTDLSTGEAVQIDGGLLSGPFEFRGKPSRDPAASTILRHRAPIRGSQPPGIDAARLPRF